jgi:predicted metallo-beta-lactamase superfamily hydrolase
MMTRVDLGGRVFVHASDIQLLDAATIDRILDWAPHWVLAAGPPLYLGQLDAGLRARAWDNARRLAAGVDALILDHHLMRSLEGLAWLEDLSSEVGKRVVCAADFMGRPRELLEAQRRELYAAMPVRAGWHADYALGRTRVEDFAPPGV